MFAGIAAWCTSISYGYNTPALETGLAATAFLVLAGCTVPVRFQAAGLIALAVFSVSQFWAVRHHHVYLDRPAAELTHDLAGNFPGAAGIRTNPTTAAVPADLKQAVAKHQKAGKAVAILPDFASYWARRGGEDGRNQDAEERIEDALAAIAGEVRDRLRTVIEQL